MKEMALASRHNVSLSAVRRVFSRFERRTRWPHSVESILLHTLLPVGALLLVLAGLRPWLAIPLIGERTAWDIPVRIGWWSAPAYGSYATLGDALAALLCLRFVLAMSGEKWRIHTRTFVRFGCLAGALPVLFAIQFTLLDMHDAVIAAMQERESLFIQGHLGYSIAPQLLQLAPADIQPDSLIGRSVLLVQLLREGALLPLVVTLLYVGVAYYISRRSIAAFTADPPRPSRRSVSKRVQVGVVVLALIGLALIAKAPAGLVAASLAAQASDSADYPQALQLIDMAVWLNPSIELLPSTHVLRGEIFFHNSNGRLAGSPDIALYVAAQARATNRADLAWQADQVALQEAPQQAAVQLDSLTTLETMIEQSIDNTALPTSTDSSLSSVTLASSLNKGQQVLPLLARIRQLNPEDVYSSYLSGRIRFASHQYTRAAQDFESVLAHTHDPDMRSTAYTYLAFCEAANGNDVLARVLLLHSVELDRGYYNTTAREALSGLH